MRRSCNVANLTFFIIYQYLYNIESVHEYPKGMLELLRCLEWKKLQAKAEANLDICI